METLDRSPATSGSDAVPLPGPAAPAGGRPAREWIARTVLAAAILLFIAPWSPRAPAVVASALGRAVPRSLGAIVEPVVQIGLDAAWRLALVTVIGGVTPWAIGGSWRAWWKQVGAVGTFCAVATIARWPSMLGVQTLPLTVGLGLWAWLSVRLVGTSRTGGLAWLGVSGAAVAACVALLLGRSFESAPSITAVPPITKEDRARLEEMLRLAADTGDEIVEVELSAADLNGLAAAWLAPRSADSRVSFSGQEETLRLRLSHPVRGRERNSFLNVDVEMQPWLAAGRLSPGLTGLRVGRVRFPSVLVGHVSSVVGDIGGRTPRIAGVLNSLSELSFAAGRLRISADPDRASTAFADSMAASPGASDRLRADTREIMQALVEECHALPAGDERCVGLVRKAFEIAERRSGGGNAAEQNRAALVALGIQIGDRRVRRFAGFPAREEMTTFGADFDKKTTLHGRNDLARHFLVSAALRALSTRDIGMAMGLLKEKLDAVDGGSGFSFTDIAADMAGLRFADNVLDPDRAARMQRRVQEESAAETLLPSLEGLTDGLSEPMFKRLYGSTTDKRYRTVIAVIDHRMESSAILAGGRTDGGR